MNQNREYTTVAGTLAALDNEIKFRRDLRAKYDDGLEFEEALEDLGISNKGTLEFRAAAYLWLHWFDGLDV